MVIFASICLLRNSFSGSILSNTPWWLKNYYLFCCCKGNYVFQKYKDEISFDNKCKQLVMRRMIEQTSDYRFNPLVAIGCRIDIDKFCHHIVDLQPKDQELQGKVVKCLKVPLLQGLVNFKVIQAYYLKFIEMVSSLFASTCIKYVM